MEKSHTNDRIGMEEKETPTNGENAHEMCAFYICVCQSQCG